MLADISNVDAIYIVCGRTDMRKSIDGLCAIIQEQFSMEIDHALYLFCGRKCDRIKAILKEPDGIVMIYKRLTAQGSYRWPRDKSEVRNLTWREFDWLMSGIDIEQPKAIKTSVQSSKTAHKTPVFPVFSASSGHCFPVMLAVCLFSDIIEISKTGGKSSGRQFQRYPAA